MTTFRWLMCVSIALAAACGSVKSNNKPDAAVPMPDSSVTGSTDCVLDQSSLDNCKL